MNTCLIQVKSLQDLQSAIAIDSSFDNDFVWLITAWEKIFGNINFNIFLYVLETAEKSENIGCAIVYNSGRDCAELLKIVLLKKNQGLGLGSKFLKDLIKFYQHQEILQMTLQVSVANTIAIKLYESTGFKITRRLKSFYHFGTESKDALELSREL